MKRQVDSATEELPLDETCTAHNNLKPCRECWIAAIEFKAEREQEDRLNVKGEWHDIHDRS